MAQTGQIRGTLKTAAGAPVPAATVRIAAFSIETMSDSAGAFLLAEVPAGTVRLTVREPGFAPIDTRVVVRPGETVTLDLVLAENVITLAPIQTAVHGPERQRFDSIAQGSTVNLSVREISAVPALGERDVLRAVALLPGVVSRNDYSVGMNVRGGDADQNLVLLDGQVVFNPFHLGGLFSTFPDETIEGVEFLTGGFPARYGGRLASVLDVTERAGTSDSVHGSASVSILATRLHFEGPVPRLKGASWMVSARRTYADELVALLTPDQFPYHFQDLTGRLTIPHVLGGDLSLDAFGSGDYFNFELTQANTGQKAESFLFDWGNRVTGLSWRFPLGTHGSFVQRAGHSGFFADIAVGPGLFGFENRVTRDGLSGDLELRGAHHDFAAGYVLERHDISYAAGSGDIGLNVARLEYHPRTFEAYVEDQWHPVPRLMLRPGLRFTRVRGDGANFTRVAPRFNAKLFLTEQTALTASAGRFFQPIQSLRQEEIPISLFEFWIGADSIVPVGVADHYIAGVEHWWGANTSLQVEGWYKRMWDLIDGNPSGDPSQPNQAFIRASGDAHGADVFIKRTGGRVTGWISYSLTYVSRMTATGEHYPPAQDRRHTFNLVAAWRGWLGAQWTARLGYGSPLPYTALTGQWIHRFYDPGRNTWIGATTEPYRSARNAARYPAYSRLDLAARWQFKWLGATWHPNASLLNAYARNNVFVYFFRYDVAPPERRGFTQFPFLPTVGIDVDF